MSHTEVWVKSLGNKRNSRDKGCSRDEEQRRKASMAGQYELWWVGGGVGWGAVVVG